MDNVIGFIDFNSTENICLILNRIEWDNFRIIIHINGGDIDSILEQYNNRFLFAINSERLILLNSIENIGFSGGCNSILDYFQKYLSSDYIILSNDDIIFKNETFKLLFDTINQNDRFQLCGTLIFDDKNNLLHSSINLLSILTIPNRVNKHFIKKKFDSSNGNIFKAKYVHGSLLIFARCLLTEILNSRGYIFDERFFAYREETELQFFIKKRLKREIGLITNNSVVHFGSRSTGGKNNSLIMYYLNRNSLLLTKLIFNRFLFLIYYVYHFFYYLFFTIVCFNFNFFVAFFDALNDFNKKKFGKRVY